MDKERLMEDKNVFELNPQEYFNYVKDKKNKITDEELQKYYDTCLELINKYKITGQVKGLKKLIFHLENVEKEREIVKLGIDTFVYRDDIEEYIDKVEKKTVKIIELERYEREIPDDIVEVISKVKDKFDKLYVVFTDYTGNVEREVQQDRRKKDPILFGTFQSEKLDAVVDRFYFLGDWVDEYCDLTLDKLVAHARNTRGINIEHKISTPQDIQELKEELLKYESANNSLNSFRVVEEKKSEGIFSKVRTAIGIKGKNNGR